MKRFVFILVKCKFNNQIYFSLWHLSIRSIHFSVWSAKLNVFFSNGIFNYKVTNYFRLHPQCYMLTQLNLCIHSCVHWCSNIFPHRWNSILHCGWSVLQLFKHNLTYLYRAVCTEIKIFVFSVWGTEVFFLMVEVFSSFQVFQVLFFHTVYRKK